MEIPKRGKESDNEPMKVVRIDRETMEGLAMIDDLKPEELAFCIQ